jgi:hypothetical protein
MKRKTKGYDRDLAERIRKTFAGRRARSIVARGDGAWLTVRGRARPRTQSAIHAGHGKRSTMCQACLDLQ